MKVLFLILILLGLPVYSYSAIDCDGVDDYALTTANLDTFKTGGTGTWMAWFTPTGANPAGGATCVNSATPKILGAASGSNAQRITLGRRGATDLCGSNFDGTTDQLIATYAGVNTTNHLAMVHTGGNIELFLNGVSTGSTASGDTTTHASPLFACNNNSASQSTFQGRVHGISVSSTAMTASEIAVLALSNRPRLRRTPATGEWLFDNCAPGTSGNTIGFRDHSGNGRVMTGGHGANASGLTCQGHSLFSFGGGVQ